MDRTGTFAYRRICLLAYALHQARSMVFDGLSFHVMIEKRWRFSVAHLDQVLLNSLFALEVTLIDETQGRNDEDLMFDTGVLNGDEVFQEPMVNTATTTSSILVSDADPVTTAGEIKSEKPKAITTTATTVTPASSRPKEKGIVFHDQEEKAPASTPIVSPLQIPQAKDKGKAKMVEPEKPLTKKDQITIDEEVARNLEAQRQAELEEEERLSRQKEEEANIALIESWDNTQAMMDADFQLAQQMQTEEQE
ncbi:hypothetical protein Tco_0363485 [Tanacetum coccineum]